MILAPWMWSRGGALHVTDRHSNLGPAPLGARLLSSCHPCLTSSLVLPLHYLYLLVTLRKGGCARDKAPLMCPEPRGALNLWAGRGAQIPSKSPPPNPLVGRRRRATVTFGPEWLRVARTACSPRGLGTSLVTAWP